MQDEQEALARVGIFQGVAPEAIAAVAGRLGQMTFRRGHQVFVQGEAGDRLYIVVEGKVKIARRTDDGRENVLAVLGCGDVFGELALFDPGVRTSTVTTLTEVRALTMDREMLRGWIREHPEIGEQLLRVLARRLRRTNDVLTDTIFVDVPGRVAKHLLALAQRFGVRDGPGLRVNHELTQQELAQMVGGSRETVNKALSYFAQRGWIHVEGKSVLIIDPEKLAARAR